MSSGLLCRRRLLGQAAACVVTPWIGAASQARMTAGGRQSLRLAIGGRGSLYHLPVALALQLGFLREEGLEPVVQDYPGGAAVLRAMSEDEADVGSGGYEHVITAHSRGKELRSIVLQGRVPQLAAGVSVRAIPDFRHWQQLKGHKIGVTVPGSSSHLVMATAMARAGLPPESVTFVGVGGGAGALEALRSGQIAAICNVEPVISQLEHRGEIKIIADTRTLKGTRAVFGGLLPSTCLYASETLVRNQPELCHALARSIGRALKWLRTASLQDMLRAVPEGYFLGDRGQYLLAFSKVRESYSLDGLIDPTDTEIALQALSQFNPVLRDHPVELARTYTNRFAQEAKVALLL